MGQLGQPVLKSDYIQEIERLKEQIGSIKSMEDKIKELEIEIKDKDDKIDMLEMDLEALTDY